MVAPPAHSLPVPIATRLVRIADGLLALLTVCVGVFMAARSQTRGTSFIFPSAAIASIVFLTSAALVAAGLWLLHRVPSRAARIGCRGVLYAVAMAYIGLGRGRINNWSGDFIQWPPLATDSRAADFSVLDPQERAVWALRIVTHLLGGGQAISADTLRIPSDWPFPKDVEVAARVTARSVVAWAHTVGSDTICVMHVSGEHSGESPASADDLGCTASARPHGVTFTIPLRAPPDTATRRITTPSPHEPVGTWLQYRNDAAKTGAAFFNGTPQTPWRARIDGPVRSTAAAAGGAILVGAHGTGALAAFDQATGRTRWQARAPNWIHQDAISDGRVVVVGFGENLHRIPLHTPAGVAAYDVTTGERLWTRFDESSVMTSPVIRGEALVYITEGGVVRKRSVRTGELLGELRLPGSAVMAPPAVQGDSLVATLENSEVCVVLISTMSRAWCRTAPDLKSMGHTGPAIIGTRIVVSGHVPLYASWRVQLSDASLASTARLFRKMAQGQTTIGGQSFRALDIRDGTELWRSRTYAARTLSGGHISGTAAAAGDFGVILLPLADTVVAFSVSTGRTLWTAPGHGSRGPPLIVGSRVVTAGGDGWIEVRTIATGALECSVHADVGYDRSGPTLVGQLMVFVNFEGAVEAYDKDDVLRCSIRKTPPPTTNE